MKSSGYFVVLLKESCLVGGNITDYSCFFYLPITFFLRAAEHLTIKQAWLVLSQRNWQVSFPGCLNYSLLSLFCFTFIHLASAQISIQWLPHSLIILLVFFTVFYWKTAFGLPSFLNTWDLRRDIGLHCFHLSAAWYLPVLSAVRAWMQSFVGDLRFASFPLLKTKFIGLSFTFSVHFLYGILLILVLWQSALVSGAL